MKIILITDSCCDLPLSYVEQNELKVLPLSVNFKGKEIKDDLGKTIKHEDFYAAVRAGEMPSTSQINVQTFIDVFNEYLNQGFSVIYMGFSSALSGCINSAMIARETILEENKAADITVIDTKCASMGQGLLFYYAYNMLKSGCSKDELINWIEANKLKVIHWFTVDDLNHLKRGGRVSSAAAVVGTLLNIKPVMHVDDEGRLIPVLKAKGRKKSLRILADMFKENAVKPEEQVVFISHGDCVQDAEAVRDMILEEFKVKDVVISPIGPAVGSHSGPGTVALFFMGNKR